MPTLTLTTEQIIDLIQQLPLEQKRIVLLELAKKAETQRPQGKLRGILKSKYPERHLVDEFIQERREETGYE
ncbi:SpoVT/AbrB domain-containing protein [Planktothrix mougeotii]|uniref:SpoVT/AbrB domain-containing protein n=1 Tax=Planktothrix mougeotii LEGE 06226 TaxID=1828728 RepID=A0ABR9UBY8_9CYAN|nr:SpoVT/AbrB domain-containing protein [Planktothrix mougeotii]MBE9143099.1 SpoVT/AbrB domain-containing protein [Planktothrix mougeotii LEGE 06226]